MCVCGGGGLRHIIFIFEVYIVFYVVAIILQSAGYSPMSVRYSTIEITASIIICVSFSISWRGGELRVRRPCCTQRPACGVT